jgi:hypothetical protein
VHVQHGRRGREITADHPAHSPDLAPSDFHLFLHLKKHLAGQKFHEEEEVKNEDTAACARNHAVTSNMNHKQLCGI